jgi:hypothetical protein
MSKEREILKKILMLYRKDKSCMNCGTANEIQQLLAQQYEQEPVAWKVIDKTNGEFMFSRVKPTERSHKYDVVIPLYPAPPKREPLSDKEITKNTPKLIHIGERLAFHAGVRFAEKHHGIGGEE